MMVFQYHADFEKEIAAFERRRFRYTRESLARFQKLCEKQFDPISPESRIAPGKLHRVTQNDAWTIWKTELPIINSGLRPNQYPRMWFAVRGEVIAFLCMATHGDNYNNQAMDQLASERITDLQ